MDLSSFFSSSGGTSGGSGKGGGAGYSSDVQDSGKNTATTNVTVGGIGTTSSAASLGNAYSGNFMEQLLIGIAAAIAVALLVRR